jgi:hypothetical protein
LICWKAFTSAWEAPLLKTLLAAVPRVNAVCKAKNQCKD